MQSPRPTRSEFVLITTTWLSLAAVACSSSTSPQTTGSGGEKGSGGGTATSEATGAAGRIDPGSTNGSGGSIPSGGQPGSAGAPASGGRPGSGGVTASGGQPGSGGVTGSGGRLGSGGVATGGQPGSGGMTASGGRGGSMGTGGRTGTGGTTGSGTGGSANPGVDGGVINPTACSTGTAQTGDVTVSLSSRQQKISGFGVSSAWAGSYRNASDADYLWSTTKGAGMTFLRIRYGDGLAIAKSAASLGVKVWMCPWGTGNNGAKGGTYTTTQTNPNGCSSSQPVLTNPTGFASALVTWVQNAKTQGVPIYAVSAGNEPDSCGINDTTSYSAAQMATWIETLGPAMADLGVKVMAPETMNWYAFPSYFTAIQKDAAAYKYVDIFAGHRYGRGPDNTSADVVAANKAIAADTSKEYWETEVDTGTASGDSTGDGIGSALLMAKQMHADLTVANLNAWHLWWVYNASGNGGCLYDTSTNTWTKRLWVMGNYARFVRPGYMRVSTSGTVPSGVLLTAYTNPADGTVAVVAVNNNASATPLSLFISGAVPCTMTPWVTSATDSLVSKSAITVSNARLTATLDATSVTTFVGKP
jgi:glucuronoarabinoxylan endo-1,4-beta-xylanase